MKVGAFFSDLLVGIICIMVVFAIVLCVTTAIKERSCDIVFVNQITGETETRHPGEYRILPVGFQFVNGTEWCYCTWDYLMQEGQQ